MRILFVSEYYPPAVCGGGEINLELVAGALASRGHDVTVLTSFTSCQKEQTVNGVRVLRKVRAGSPGTITGNLRRLMFSRSAIKCLPKENFDVVHLIGSALSLAKKIQGAAVVATVESYISLCPKGDFMCGDRVKLGKWSLIKTIACILRSGELGKVKNVWYLRFNPVVWLTAYFRYKKLFKSLSHANLIAISHFCKKLLSERSLDSVVIPNFVSFNKNVVKKPQPYFTISYLGSLTYYKGAMFLLRSLDGIDCKVNFYGTGNLKGELESYAKFKGINATFHDPLPYFKVPQIYSSSDCVVFPSLWPEPFGRISIEAHANKTPVIASNIGGIRETVPRGCGILVNPGDVTELRSAVLRLMQNPKLAQELAFAGHAFAKKYYSKKVVIDKLTGFYEGLI